MCRDVAKPHTGLGRAGRTTAAVTLTRRRSGSIVKALPAKAAHQRRQASKEVKGRAHPVLPPALRLAWQRECRRLSMQHPVLIDELPDHTFGDLEARTIFRDPHTRVVPDDAIAGDRIE